MTGMSEQRTHRWPRTLRLLAGWGALACAITLAGYHAAKELHWILPNHAVQFIFGIWLISLLFVRIVFKAIGTLTSNRENPQVACWGTVVLVVVLVGYLSSFVPGADDKIISSLGVAFVAFAVWLTVRIVNRRERWAKRTGAILVAFLVLYPLSFGPACWWLSNPRTHHGKGRTWIEYEVPYAYWPVGWIACNGPESLEHQIVWYSKLLAGDRELALPIGPRRGAFAIYSK